MRMAPTGRAQKANTDSPVWTPTSCCVDRQAEGRGYKQEGGGAPTGSYQTEVDPYGRATGPSASLMTSHSYLQREAEQSDWSQRGCHKVVKLASCWKLSKQTSGASLTADVKFICFTCFQIESASVVSMSCDPVTPHPPQRFAALIKPEQVSRVTHTSASGKRFTKIILPLMFMFIRRFIGGGDSADPPD